MAGRLLCLQTGFEHPVVGGGIHEYMNEIKGGRKYLVINTLPSEGRKL